MEIKPGSTIKITVTSTLRSEKARKTLGRIFLKDPAILKTRSEEPKPVTWRRRAGRYWHEQPSGSILRAPKMGETARIRATVDVIRDLSSVEKYIRVE